jgi:hypothetical protein
MSPFLGYFHLFKKNHTDFSKSTANWQKITQSVANVVKLFTSVIYECS